MDRPGTGGEAGLQDVDAVSNRLRGAAGYSPVPVLVSICAIDTHLPVSCGVHACLPLDCMTDHTTQ